MRTHPLNVSYLVLGLILLGVAGSWALQESGFIEVEGIRWLLPLVLVASGLLGLIAFAAKGGSRRAPEATRDARLDDPEDTGDTDHPDHPDHTEQTRRLDTDRITTTTNNEGAPQ